MSFLAELKRRNVVRVAVAYLVVGWLVLQVAQAIFPTFGAPEWVLKVFIALIGLGFPLALILSWAYEMTPEGVKKTEEVDTDASITRSTGQKLNYLIIAALVAALGYVGFDKYLTVGEVETAPVETALEASIAVLPFTDLSAAGDQAYFADGLSEEILNVLVGVDGLTVASRTSSFQFKGRDVGIPEIASKLNVSFVLEGSVRKAGGTIRVTGQLIEAVSDRHLWSETYDRELTAENIFAIQDEIATAIVAALGQELDLAPGADAIEVRVGTKDLSAYEAFLEGRGKFTGRATLADVMDAIALLEAATTADPAFAEAWQWLAAAYSVAPSWLLLAGQSMADNLDYLDRSEQAIQKALALDPDLGFVYAIRGSNREHRPDPDYDAAVNSYKKALALKPDDATAHLWLAVAYRDLGFFDLADQHFSRCLAISPLYVNCYLHKSLKESYLGRTESADRLSEKVLEISPESTFIFTESFASYSQPEILKGNNLGARLIIGLSAPDPGGFPTDGWIAAVQDPGGDHGETIRRMDAWLAGVTISKLSKALIYMTLGAWDRVPVFTWEDVSPPLWFPQFSGYRKSPGFKASIRNLNMDDYWRKNGFPPGCRPLGEDDFECD